MQEQQKNKREQKRPSNLFEQLQQYREQKLMESGKSPMRNMNKQKQRHKEVERMEPDRFNSLYDQMQWLRGRKRLDQVRLNNLHQQQQNLLQQQRQRELDRLEGGINQNSKITQPSNSDTSSSRDMISQEQMLNEDYMSRISEHNRQRLQNNSSSNCRTKNYNTNYVAQRQKERIEQCNNMSQEQMLNDDFIKRINGSQDTIGNNNCKQQSSSSRENCTENSTRRQQEQQRALSPAVTEHSRMNQLAEGGMGSMSQADILQADFTSRLEQLEERNDVKLQQQRLAIEQQRMDQIRLKALQRQSISPRRQQEERRETLQENPERMDTLHHQQQRLLQLQRQRELQRLQRLEQQQRMGWEQVTREGNPNRIFQLQEQYQRLLQSQQRRAEQQQWLEELRRREELQQQRIVEREDSNISLLSSSSIATEQEDLPDYYQDNIDHIPPPPYSRT